RGSNSGPHTRSSEMVHYSLALLLTAAVASAFDSTEIRMLQDESGGPLNDGFGHAAFGPIRLQSREMRDSRIRRQVNDRIREVLGSIRLVKMTVTKDEGDDDSSLEDKRSAPLIRFGKRSVGDEEMARTIRQDALGSPLIRFGKRSAPEEDEELVEEDGDLLERYARAPASAPLIRFGKRSPDTSPLIRFGRAPSSAPLIRFGKRSSTAPFVRFGRTASAPLIRFGKR
ncbi:hypothetical protein PENTCL1PPCAC_19174, partial [Pristionchus entomophagus]